MAQTSTSLSANDPQKEQVSAELQGLLKHRSISKDAYEHVASILEHEWGAPKGHVKAAPGKTDALFVQLDSNLRNLTQSNDLSQEALGAIYLIISTERAGEPVVGTPMTQQHQEKHRSLFGRKSNATASGQHHKLNLSASRLGQIAIDSTARGFGFFLGGDAANELVHGLF